MPERRAHRLIDHFRGRLDAAAQALLEDASAGIAVLDSAGAIVVVNRALRELLPPRIPLTPGEPIIPIFAATAERPAKNELEAMLRGHAPSGVIMTALQGADIGAELSVGLTASLLREPDDSVSGVILRFVDITPQRALEAQLAQSEKLLAIGQLAGGVAHDFNNLLTVITGAADDALEHLDRGNGLSAGTAPDPVHPAMAEDLRQIQASAGRAAALVTQLLAFGRQQVLQPEVLSVNDAIQELCRMLRLSLGEKVTLRLELEEPGRKVRVDRTQFDRILINLMLNGRDAMPDGGTLTVRSGHVSLLRPLVQGQETIPPGRYVMIEVQDTGVGIAPDVLPRIFEPFFTTRRRKEGHGLGLASVHGIVRQSNGFISVQSELGRGTSFRVYFPRFDGRRGASVPLGARPEQPQPRLQRPKPGPCGDALTEASNPVSDALPASAPAASEPPRATTTEQWVLLVEDEAPVRRLAERVLARRWRVMAAASGEDALAAVEAMPPERPLALVVSDVVMPGMDGPELMRRLRERRPGLQGILVSGYAEEELRRQLAADGMTFLAKPYAPRDLLALADSVAAGTA